MSDSTGWESHHVGVTESRWRRWKIRITWRRVASPSGNGYTYPAGVEMRSWDIPVGLPADRMDQVVDVTHDRPPELVSDLFKKQIQWGQLLNEHRQLLAEQIKARTERARLNARPGGAVEQWATTWEEVADRAERGRATRTTAAQRQSDVRDAYRTAERDNPRQVALETLRGLQRKGYELQEANKSDRAKVRRWISEWLADTNKGTQMRRPR